MRGQHAAAPIPNAKPGGAWHTQEERGTKEGKRAVATEGGSYGLSSSTSCLSNIYI